MLEGQDGDDQEFDEYVRRLMVDRDRRRTGEDADETPVIRRLLDAQDALPQGMLPLGFIRRHVAGIHWSPAPPVMLSHSVLKTQQTMC